MKGKWHDFISTKEKLKAMKTEPKKATPIKKLDRPEPITKDSAKKQTAESVKGTSSATKTSGDTGQTSTPEQLGEKENASVDAASQALNDGTTKVNDGSNASGFNASE